MSLNYKKAGVDTELGQRLVDRIAPLAASTFRPEVLAGPGGFGALCSCPSNYQNPVLVSGADGVGTKLKLAIAADRHEVVGEDLVAMCVNDVLTLGAEPLIFLDYLATATLDLDTATRVIDGIAVGCRRAGCALVGGETAEMPDMYHQGEYDLAGFCVGVVERDQILGRDRVQPGDQLVGLPASGPHANGYALIRRILQDATLSIEADWPGGALADALLMPTKIYVPQILPLLSVASIHAIAHITGGGMNENLPRILPAGTGAIINTGSWDWPPIFPWLQQRGDIDTREMRAVFNCGVGMVLCVAAADLSSALQHLQQSSLDGWHIGEVQAGIEGVHYR